MKSYYKVVGGISYYRFLILVPEKGIVEIEITVAPRFAQSQIAFVELSQLTKSEYKAGFAYFIQKYAN